MDCTPKEALALRKKEQEKNLNNTAKFEHSGPMQGLSNEDIDEIYASINPNRSCKVCYGRGYSGIDVKTQKKVPCHKCVKKQFVDKAKERVKQKMAELKPYVVEENKDGRTTQDESSASSRAGEAVRNEAECSQGAEAVHAAVHQPDVVGEVRPEDSKV